METKPLPGRRKQNRSDFSWGVSAASALWALQKPQQLPSICNSQFSHLLRKSKSQEIELCSLPQNRWELFLFRIILLRKGNSGSTCLRSQYVGHWDSRVRRASLSYIICAQVSLGYQKKKPWKLILIINKIKWKQLLLGRSVQMNKVLNKSIKLCGKYAIL